MIKKVKIELLFTEPKAFALCICLLKDKQDELVDAVNAMQQTVEMFGDVNSPANVEDNQR